MSRPYSPPPVYLGSSFSTSSQTCYFLLFWWWPSHWMWNGISWWFGHVLLYWLMILSIFSCTFWPYVYLLWRKVFSDLLPSFYGLFFFLLWSRKEFFTYSAIEFLIGCQIWKTFLLFCGFSLHFLDGSLWSTNLFNFELILLISFLSFLVLLVSYLRSHCVTKVTKIYTYVFF